MKIYLQLLFSVLLPAVVISVDVPEKQCALQCAEGDPTSSSFPSSKANLLSMYQMYNYSDINIARFCDLMNATNECYQNCQPVHLKYAFSKQYELAKFICQQTNFGAYLPCFASVTNRVMSTCFETESDFSCFNQRQNFLIYKVGYNITDSINAFCKYLKCVFECRRLALINECGTKADDEMKTFFNIVWEMQTKYYYNDVVMSDYVTCKV